jgi:hypothetical protein
MSNQIYHLRKALEHTHSATRLAAELRIRSCFPQHELRRLQQYHNRESSRHTVIADSLGNKK